MATATAHGSSKARLIGVLAIVVALLVATAACIQYYRHGTANPYEIVLGVVFLILGILWLRRAAKA